MTLPDWTRDRLREMAGETVAMAFGVKDTEMDEQELRWALRASLRQAAERIEQHHKDVTFMAELAGARP